MTTGSLQAAQAIGASIKTLLGPSRSLKCCIGDTSYDSTDSIICSSTIKILQYLDVKHPAWYIINDASEAMYKSCGSGCKTLVCMIGFWSRQAAALQYQGIPIPVIVELFHEALDESIKVLEEIQIPLQQVKKHLNSRIVESDAKEDDEFLGNEMRGDTPVMECVMNSPTATCVNTPKNLNHRDCIASNHNKEVDNDHGCEEDTDEFDACFDGLPTNTPNCTIKTSYHPSSSSSQKYSEKSKLHSNSNTAELKRTEEMLQKLSFLGLNPRSKQTKRNHLQIIFGSRNLVPETPKTATNNINLETETATSCDFDLQNRQDIELLGHVLSHGKKEMSLAIDAIFDQILQSKSETFEVDKNCIHTETICGPSNQQSQVIDGILVKTNSTLKCPKLNINAIVVSGDITKEFKHAGYKDSFKVKQTYDKVGYQSCFHHEKQTWLAEVTEVIKTMRIGVIFCRGVIDKDVEEFCQAHGIITINSVSSKVLQLLSTSLQANIAVYVIDIKPSDLSKPVSLHSWTLPRSGTSQPSYIIVKPYSPSNERCHAHTVFLCSPSQQLVMESELVFWSCVSCVQNTINHGHVLPGGGTTELACVKKLRQLAAKSVNSSEMRSSSWIKRSLPTYRQTVYSAFSDGLEEFVRTLILNTGKDHSQTIVEVNRLLQGDNIQRKMEELSVVDDYVAKVNAWRRAVGVVCMLLQSDMIIETSSQQN